MDAAQPPRHLLRRFFAYAIDVALAWLIAFLGMALVLDDPILGKLDRETQSYSLGAGLESGSFAPPVYVSSRTCGDPVDLLPALRNYVAPATITQAEACFERKNGVPVGGYATLTLADTPEAGDLAGQDIRVPLKLETGHRYADAMAFFVFLAGSILGLRLFGTTPGKRIMGLRVIGAAPIPALRRELVRNLPHLLIVPTFLVINLILRPMPAVPPIAQGIAVSLELLSIAAVLAFWVYPALRWRGAFFHDRWLGLSVVRLRDLPPGPLPTA